MYDGCNFGMMEEGCYDGSFFCALFDVVCWISIMGFGLTGQCFRDKWRVLLRESLIDPDSAAT